nr:hypothetical protein [Actinomycetales bacterium]
MEGGRLLSGPRGRRLCLELMMHLDEEVRAATYSAAYELDPGAGTSRSRFVFGEDPGEPPTVAPEDVAAALDQVTLGAPSEAALLHALDLAVSMARYWQEPDGEDLLAAHPAVSAALERVAGVVVETPEAVWWAEPIERTSQHLVSWWEEGHPFRPTRDAAAALAVWRAEAEAEEARAARERPTDPAARWSGVWWSTPPVALASTTRLLPDRGPVGLSFVEDFGGWEEASVEAVSVPAGARVLEIDGPEAWADLCRRHPLPVTASRRHDWFRTTGRGDVAWVQPDWASVAGEVDAVHVSVWGYLTTAGLAGSVDDGVASVLAGWSPDATYWLTGQPEGSGFPRRWTLDNDSREWRPA